ncbi:MAG: hypothetical protein K6B69_04945 [Lachnospiraceae bacterium]|nr:hypothetical protein [Lachnospiraceae bacterium]
MWYVVQTTVGKEESALADCKAAVGDAADRFILSKCQFSRRIQGERKMIEKVAFPGYFFIESDVPETLEKLLMRIPGVVTPVRIGGGFHPIRQEEETMLKQMMDENDCILYSVGNILDGKLIVEEGPLKRFTGKVIKIKRHDRWADIEMPLFEKCKTMKVGLEIKAKVTAEEYRAMKKLIEAFMKSNKTLEEAIAFFESDVKPDEVPIVTKRRGSRRKKKTT